MPGRQPQDVQVIDISMGGTRLMAGPVVPSGANVTLSLDGFGNVLTGTIIVADETGIHLRFNLDEPASAALRQTLSRTEDSKAA